MINLSDNSTYWLVTETEFKLRLAVLFTKEFKSIISVIRLLKLLKLLIYLDNLNFKLFYQYLSTFDPHL